MLSLQNVTCGYGAVPVLRNVTLSFPDGSITALLGCNGCGKSTLLRTAARLLPPIAGNVLLDDSPITAFTPRAFAQRVAVLPQARDIPAMTVDALVEHGRFPWLGLARRPQAADHRICEDAMHKTGVYELRRRELRTLSGGERQKAYLAMTIAQNADLLFLDEPTTYLDIAHQFEFLELVDTLHKEGKTIVMVLHDLSHALHYSERIAVFDEGRLRCCDAPAALAASGVLQEVFGIRLQQVGTQYCIFPKRNSDLPTLESSPFPFI